MPKRPPSAHPARSGPKRGTDLRPSAHRRGYTRKWAAFRKRFLANNPWCKGIYTARFSVGSVSGIECGELATQVDHIIPLKWGGAQYDESNCQSLCHSCHSRKTATENHERRRNV